LYGLKAKFHRVPTIVSIIYIIMHQGPLPLSYCLNPARRTTTFIPTYQLAT
jgi:hypothetical protein